MASVEPGKGVGKLMMSTHGIALLIEIVIPTMQYNALHSTTHQVQGHVNTRVLDGLYLSKLHDFGNPQSMACTL